MKLNFLIYYQIYKFLFMILPQLVKLHAFKYIILELKDIEQNYETFMHILHISVFFYNNSVINCIYLTLLYFKSI